MIKIDLEQNILKQQNLLNAIKQLSDPFSYYNTSHRSQLAFNRNKRKQLRHCYKKLKRLTVVIEKQSKLRIFKY